MYKNYFKFIALYVFIVVIPFLAHSATPFKFAFFTDLHVSESKMEAADDLLNAVNEVNASGNIDFVLVSGDITQNGDRNSLVEAKQILQKLKIPFYIVAGNHDFRWTTSGPIVFDEVFGDNKFSFTHKGCKFIGFTTTPLTNSGNGFIMNQDIVWMKKELSKVAKKMPIYVVTHYPLQTGDVDNWYSMTDILRKYNVQSMLGGHYHRNTFLNYDGIPGVILRSTLRGKETLGGYSILTVADSLSITEKRINQPEQNWLTLAITKKKYKKPDMSIRPIVKINTAK